MSVMDSYTYTFFRANKRVNLRDDNLQVDKIARIFQVIGIICLRLDV